MMNAGMNHIGLGSWQVMASRNRVSSLSEQFPRLRCSGEPCVRNQLWCWEPNAGLGHSGHWVCVRAAKVFLSLYWTNCASCDRPLRLEDEPPLTSKRSFFATSLVFFSGGGFYCSLSSKFCNCGRLGNCLVSCKRRRSLRFLRPVRWVLLCSIRFAESGADLQARDVTCNSHQHLLVLPPQERIVSLTSSQANTFTVTPSQKSLYTMFACLQK